MPNALIQTFRQTGLFTEEQLMEIFECYRQVQFQRGELFLKAGRIANDHLFLEKGFMRSFVFDTEGNEITLNFFPASSFVFDVASLFMRVPTEENIEATEPSSGYALSFEKLNQLFHQMPPFREFGRSILVKGFASFKLRTLAMINKTAEQRYAMLMQTNPTVFEHAPLKHIASYLGITDTSLSRIRKNFGRK